MTTYVLVHGGFSGGWVWREVASFLRAADHEVFTPTLTGLGERSHLAHPGVDLNTHIQDVVGVLECEELSYVVLVGHSSGSMVITGVAEKVPERLGHLVYLDTAIPEDGQSWLELLGSELSMHLLEIAETQGDGWQIPLIPGPPRFQAHPLKTVAEPLEVKNPAARAIPRTFIHCTAKPNEGLLALAWPAIDRAARKAQEEEWGYYTLPAGHNVMETMPKELANLLLELV
jgi:pimeloyl-ACP methyl ester carboxylesterase